MKKEKQIMFEPLTKYLEVLKPNNFGRFIPPEKNDEGVYVLHGYQYSKDVQMFEKEVYDFAESHPEFHHTEYSQILEKNNIDLGDPLLYTKKLSDFELNIVFIILFSIIRGEHFCEGSIMNGLEKGFIQKCLEEIKKRDEYYNSNNIKEVSIVSKYVFMLFNDYWYKDLLRISPHWISYRRNKFQTDDLVTEWSYKASKENRLWDSLTNEILSSFNRDEPWTFMTDVGTFNMRVTFKNNEHWDLELSSNFADNGLTSLAMIIKKMIPSEETDYPDVLDAIPLFLYEHPLTKKELSNLKKEDICALMYAEGGAMGSPGEVCIIDIDGNKYFSSGIYSDVESEVSQIEVIETYFDGLEHSSGIGAPDYKDCFINNKRWKYINLGFGNHLYLRNDFWYEHGDRIVSVDAGQRYVNWKRLIKEQA